MSIGVIEGKENFKKGVEEIKKLNPIYKTTVKSIQLITLNRNMALKSKRSFKLT